MARHLALIVLLAAAMGCGVSVTDTLKRGGTGGTEKSDPSAVAEASKLLLREEPAGAKGVAEVRAKAKTGDEVVMIGRVGGREKPFTKGRAQFLLVDSKLKPATECECPWDYCSTEPDILVASRASVKFVDAKGATLTAEAKEAFGIKELSTVVIKGKVVRDDAGNLIVVGSKRFVKEK
jgi:hypothetical protein